MWFVAVTSPQPVAVPEFEVAFSPITFQHENTDRNTDRFHAVCEAFHPKIEWACQTYRCAASAFFKGNEGFTHIPGIGAGRWFSFRDGAASAARARCSAV